MRKSGRKLLGILLAASMAVTTVFPMQGFAAEGNGYGEAEEALAEGAAAGSSEEVQQPTDESANPEVTGEVQQPADESANPETQDGEQQPADGTQPEGTEEKQEPAEEAGLENLEEGQEPADERQDPADEGTEPETLGEQQKPSDGAQPEFSGEGQEPADGEPETDGEVPESGQEDGTEPVEDAAQPAEEKQGTEGAEMGTFMLPQRNGEDGIMPLADKFDIDKPVIESFEFKENGQKLTKADTLHFSMSVYDNDIGIESISVQIGCSDPYSSGSSVIFEKSGEGNLYTGELSCSGLDGINYYVYEIRVIDLNSNFVDWETWGDGKYRYTFTLDNKIPEVEKDDNVSVSNFQMQTNPSNVDGKLRVGDTVTYTADISYKDEEIDSVSMELHSYANSASKWESITMAYNADTQKLSGAYTITNETYPAEWYLYGIYVYTKSGKNYSFYPGSLEPDANVTFEVVQENYDTEKPVIESITIDQNGQEVKAGDVVTIKIKVKEENPSYASAHFEPQVSNVSASSRVDLEYNADTSEYVGTISITEKTYPCEWALTHLEIWDKIGHHTHLRDFQLDWDNTYPWYYKVRSGNTYREDYKKVTFQFYGLAKQEDGSYQSNSLISEKEIENVGRRDTLKALGVSFPEPIEGVKTEWKYKRWGWDIGVEVDENKEILFNSTYEMTYPMYATYDKGCANVYLTYMSKEDGMKSICQPVFVDKETTYKEVLDSFKLPADAIEDGCLGIEPNEDYYYYEGQQVGDVLNIYVEATYNYCQVAWKTRYICSDGKETTDTINKSYIEGTTISDALAELEKPATPNNLEFEAWVLSSPDGTQAITKPMKNLEATAVYRGKTTVDAFYTYRGEQGAMVSDSKLMFIDGEGLSNAAIQGEASTVFKAAAHLKGLLLSEWASDVKIDQPRYKNIQFQAQYHNCVVILNLPDKTSQYIVVEKGANYTLPTEVGNYIDIVWSGHEKGATVTVSGDTEFTVQEYKESAKGGIKLSDQEVADIIEKIKNAAEGETISIDMKKATVIPKEVQEAIQGKSVNIVLNMDGYSWTLNGMDVAATNLKDIDLEVKVDTNAIPSNIVASIAGDSPTTQLSLTHNGDFGFRADLSLNLGSEHSGSTGNLYYYDSDGKLIFINAGQIGADGTTSLPFSHASDYVIVIEKKSADTDKIDRDDETDDSSQKDNIIKDKDAKDGGSSTDEFATIEKKPTNPTTDSNAPKKDNTSTAPLKSPKTGE